LSCFSKSSSLFWMSLEAKCLFLTIYWAEFTTPSIRGSWLMISDSKAWNR
jgi:hypothetical protein